MKKRKKLNVLIVIGTRPEAIKMAPVIINLKKNKKFRVKLCITAQHRKMLDDVLNFFQLKPDYDLNIMKKNQSLFILTSNILLEFQKELNMSFIQYYTILRMLTALKLLLDEKLSVNEVALKVGYNSLPTFSNTFNKVVGIRPSEYVKQKELLIFRLTEAKVLKFLALDIRINYK